MAEQTILKLAEPPADKLAGPTWVYFACCSHGAFLYIGVAHDVNKRVRQHRKKKDWWAAEVSDMLAFQYPTRQQALEVEAHYIKHYRPPYNISGQPGPVCMPHEVPPHDYTELACLDSRGRRT